MAAACAVALAVAATAAAGPPTKAPAPSPTDFTISGSCAFDVIVHVDAQNESAITFGSGTTLVTGQLQVTLTNAVKKGNSLRLNIPGPGWSSAASDGTFTLQVAGPWLVFIPGSMRYMNGRGALTVDPAGNPTFVQQAGRSTDLCAALG
jgi:hypothetical protein